MMYCDPLEFFFNYKKLYLYYSTSSGCLYSSRNSFAIRTDWSLLSSSGFFLNILYILIQSFLCLIKTHLRPMNTFLL